MQRIIVMGPPGSGKSTLARQLGAAHGLPVFHLDQAFWRPGWTQPPPGCFEAEVARLAALPAWVIDGNSTRTLGPRLARADLVLLLEAPRWLTLPRLLRRMVGGHGQVRADAAPGCPEWLDLEFLRYAWSWNGVQRSQMLAVLDSFPGPKVAVRTAADRRRRLARP